MFARVALKNQVKEGFFHLGRRLKINGLDYNGLDTGHTHASTVQSDITECNQRRLVDSCNNRAIDKLH